MPEKTPDTLSLLSSIAFTDASPDSPSDVQAADGDSAPKIPRVSIVAYTGAVVEVGGWRYPVGIDLEGIQIPSHAVPLRFAHDTYSRDEALGHADRVAVEDGRLMAAGLLSRDTPATRDVVASSKQGYPWQASVGIRVDEVEFIKEGMKAAINGREAEGPVYHITKSRLMEISVVDLGADRNTTVNVAASAKKGLEMSETKIPDNKAPEDKAVLADNSAAIIDRAKKERDRRAGIVALAVEYSDIPNAPLAEIEQITAKAEAEGWGIQQTEVELMRATRPKAFAVRKSADELPKAKVLEAALCLQAGISDEVLAKDRDYGERVVEQAWQHRTLGLRGVIATALAHKGFSNLHGATQLYDAILQSQHSGVQASGASTINLPGILGAVANKMLLAAFTAVEVTYDVVADLADFSNFHAHELYRLDHLGEFARVPASGTLGHGKLSETTFSNQLDTFGQMLHLPRKAIINDDLGAFRSLAAQLARKARLAVEKALALLVCESSDSFYTAGQGNKITSNGLSIAGLGNAEAAMMLMADADGDPIYATPSVLLVPPGLKALADSIYVSTTLNETTTANVGRPTDNPYRGRFKVASSPYLASSAIAGYSASTWYLLANPALLPAFQVAFLDGRRFPTFETGPSAFDTLGMAMRCYWDFGVGRLDYRGATKNVA